MFSHDVADEMAGSPGVRAAFVAPLMAALIAGCAGIEPSPPEPAAASVRACPPEPARPAPVSGSAGELLALFSGLSAMSADELRRELLLVQRAFMLDPNDANRVRLAMTLAVARPPLRDDPRLQRLLEGVEAGAHPTEVRELLLLMQRLVVERGRAVRDEQRRADVSSRDEVRRVEQRLREEQERSAELRHKLDALMELERRMRREPAGTAQ